MHSSTPLTSVVLPPPPPSARQHVIMTSQYNLHQTPPPSNNGCWTAQDVQGPSSSLRTIDAMSPGGNNASYLHHHTSAPPQSLPAQEDTKEVEMKPLDLSIRPPREIDTYNTSSSSFVSSSSQSSLSTWPRMSTNSSSLSSLHSSSSRSGSHRLSPYPVLSQSSGSLPSQVSGTKRLGSPCLPLSRSISPYFPSYQRQTPSPYYLSGSATPPDTSSSLHMLSATNRLLNGLSSVSTSQLRSFDECSNSPAPPPDLIKDPENSRRATRPQHQLQQLSNQTREGEIEVDPEEHTYLDMDSSTTVVKSVSSSSSSLLSSSRQQQHYHHIQDNQYDDNQYHHHHPRSSHGMSAMYNENSTVISSSSSLSSSLSTSQNDQSDMTSRHPHPHPMMIDNSPFHHHHHHHQQPLTSDFSTPHSVRSQHSPNNSQICDSSHMNNNRNNNTNNSNNINNTSDNNYTNVENGCTTTTHAGACIDGNTGVNSISTTSTLISTQYTNTSSNDEKSCAPASNPAIDFASRDIRPYRHDNNNVSQHQQQPPPDSSSSPTTPAPPSPWLTTSTASNPNTPQNNTALSEPLSPDSNLSRSALTFLQSPSNNKENVLRFINGSSAIASSRHPGNSVTHTINTTTSNNNNTNGGNNNGGARRSFFQIDRGLVEENGGSTLLAEDTPPQNGDVSGGSNPLDFWISKILMDETPRRRCGDIRQSVHTADGNRKIRLRLVDLIELQVEQSLLKA